MTKHIRRKALQILILAAGKGVRLGSHAANAPKSLVWIDEEHSYLWYQLTSLSDFSFSNCFIVGGYESDKIQGFLKDFGFNNYQLLLNGDFEKGNLYSLLTAKQQITEGFYLFNADHYYSKETYQKIFLKPSDKITVYCDRDRKLGDDDMKVLSEEGVVKAMSKTLSDFDCGYVGVTQVPESKLPVYWNACDQVAKNLEDKAYVEAVINLLAEQGEPIRICDVSGSWWTEIDTPEDLEKAKKTILAQGVGRKA